MTRPSRPSPSILRDASSSTTAYRPTPARRNVDDRASTRYPDFTVEDEISGRTIYWEHLGMLAREEYRASWEKKLVWYRANGIHPVSEAQSGAPMLVTTTDSTDTGLNMVHAKQLIAQVCCG